MSSTCLLASGIFRLSALVMGFNSTLPAGLLPAADVAGMREFLSLVITPRVPKAMDAQVSIYVPITLTC